MMLRPFVWLSLGLLLHGCRAAESPINCADFAAAGINVRVKDSVTGMWTASGASLITISQLGVVDSTAFPADRPDIDSLPLASAWEQAGTFQVRVRRSGYREWNKAGVQVTSGVCHVHPVQLTASLQPS
jgi:hypothetical protein